MQGYSIRAGRSRGWSQKGLISRSLHTSSASRATNFWISSGVWPLPWFRHFVKLPLMPSTLFGGLIYILKNESQPLVSLQLVNFLLQGLSYLMPGLTSPCLKQVLHQLYLSGTLLLHPTLHATRDDWEWFEAKKKKKNRPQYLFTTHQTF